MKKLDAIKQFLQEHANVDVSFNEKLEVQVNVGVDGGTKVERVSKGGFKYWGFEKKTVIPQSDGSDKEITEFWKPLRIPYNAKSEASYQDTYLGYDTAHFEAIGLTGWNWVDKQSEWVGFDFDSIANHKQGLSNEELLSIRRQVESIPWITIRRSTSGKGLHLYIYLQPAVGTSNHTEHAALARAILSQISAILGVKLEAKVDTCGGVLWVWHRRQASDGLTLIKQGTPLTDIPTNWRGHINAISGRTKQNPPTTNSGDTKSLDELVDKTKSTQLDDEHRKLLGWLGSNQCLWWWDADRGILVCHTFDLVKAHKSLGLKGPFYTVATGKEQGNDQNAFAFPLRNGGWVIRRHTRKTPEHPIWTIDSSGWTRCYYNVPADLPTAARCYEGIERSDGFFELKTVEQAIKVLSDLGAGAFDCPNWLMPRPALIKQHKDGRALIKAARQSGTDPVPSGWTGTREGWWERLVSIQNETPEIEVPDHFIRHVVTANQDGGWYLYTRNQWIMETKDNIRQALIASGTSSKYCESIMGQCVIHPWGLVSRPFQPEYPGNRVWNKNAPQFAIDAHSNSDDIEIECPHWVAILRHCGEHLDEAIIQSKWCAENNITTGQEYLFLWAAAMFQYPNEPLPYLFFYGPQNSGKSIFHEALSLFFKFKKGYNRADVALMSTARFNAELQNAVLCVVEETNLRVHKDAYNRIKDWVTSRQLLIHEKGKTPYEIDNTTHWVQCANEPDACPIFPGDTRIVVSFVGELEREIPKRELLRSLEVEAPALLYFLLNIEVPATYERLRVPVIASAEKLEIQNVNESPIAQFFVERVYYCPGHGVSLSEFYHAFQGWLPSDLRRYWNQQRFLRCLPDKIVCANTEMEPVTGIVRGRYKGSYYHVGNVSLNSDDTPTYPLVKFYDRLVPSNEI